MDDKILAAQLRCPSGEIGIEVGIAMNEHNRDMNMKAIDNLEPESGDRILEIGPGNGAFVSHIFRQQPNIQYQAIDISKDMIEIAQTKNKDLVAAGKAKWHLGSTENMPFENDTFDKIMTVNTLYFMEPVEKHLAEIYRVLKPGGKFIMCFGSKRYMKQMPFTAHGFKLYSEDDALNCIDDAGFKINLVDVEESEVQGLTEEPILKESICVIAEK